jgi:signal transduction histidine kinase
MKGLWNMAARVWRSEWTVGLACALVLVFAAPPPAYGQRAPHWRVYKAADGLAESFSTAVTISPSERVWIRHGDSDTLSWLDGYEVHRLPCPPGGTFRIYETRTNQLWSLFSGGITAYRRDQWIQYPLPDIRNELLANPRYKIRPFPMIPGRSGRVLYVLPEKLVEYQPSVDNLRVVVAAKDTHLGRLLDMTEARDGGIWITGARGMAKLPGPDRTWKNGVVIQEFIPPADLDLENLQQPFEDDEGGVTVTAESPTRNERLVAMFDGRQWKSINTVSSKVRQAWRGPGDVIWAMGIDTLTRVEPDGSQSQEQEALLAGQFFDVATQPKGAFFLATSEGLARYAPLPWHSPPTAPSGAVVHAIAEDAQHGLWCVGAGALSRLVENRWTEFPYPPNLELKFQPTDVLCGLADGRLVFNATEQAILFDPVTTQFTPLHGPGDRRVKILGSLDKQSAIVQVFGSGTNLLGFQIQTFDGTTFRPLIDAVPTWNLGTELYFCQSRTNAGQREIWLGGNAGVGIWSGEQWKSYTRSGEDAPDMGYSFLSVDENRIWIGGSSKIFEFNGRNWSVARAMFDRVNSMVKDTDGTIWVASSDGLHRCSNGNWLVNRMEEGLPSAAVYEVFLQSKGNRLWAGSARGLSLFDPQADTDPPRALISSVNAQKEFILESTITLSFSGVDKWKFTSADRLLYSYRRDSVLWTPFAAENNIAFREMTPGAHRVELRAMDASGNVDSSSPAVFEYNVIVPWYLETRLLFISFAGLVISLFFAVVAMNRHHRLKRSYAEVEKIVAQRTHDLEKANQALLHSQKMKALGTMAAGIAHDFSNILSIIKGSAQIIETNLNDPDKIRVRVNRIKMVVDQGTSIVKAMLGFGKTEVPPAAPASINDLVEDTLKLMGDRFQNEMEFQHRFDPSIPPLACAREQIQQMLINLILNAADAMGGHGVITLLSRHEVLHPEIMVLPPNPAPSHAVITVKDTGCGIPLENLSRIFEPFYTTKAFSTRRGTGLGLSMVYELAKDQGLGLQVESESGHGSAFSIWIPIQGGKAA